MGNQNAVEEHIEYQDVLLAYKYEKKFNDSRFGEIKLLVEKNTRKKIFQKDYSSGSPQE